MSGSSRASERPVADRIAFVGGLHRSGTTPLTRWLATHPAVTGLERTGVQEDEGQHLQDVYSTAQRHGGPGRFAFDPAARLTERSNLVRPGSQARLVQAWSPFWDLDSTVLLEKSPPNLIRMRFLRAVFPRARFVMVVRHPVAVAMATQKWSHTSGHSLINHWVQAHRHLLDDAREVGSVAVVRYEDLMSDPDTTMAGLFAFLGVEPHRHDWGVSRALNDRYFTQYERALRWPRGRVEALLSRRFEEEVAQFGYSVREPPLLSEPSAEIRSLNPSLR